MKRSRIFLLIALITLTITSTAFFVKIINKPYIIRMLESDAYSYLSEPAKDYIEKVYNDTGKIIFTEKNKEDNTPYLNPDYINYLSLTSEEQEEYEIIPTPYLVEFKEVGEVNESFSSIYDLRNVSNNSYISQLKNQETLDICWAFATVEQIESNIMLRNKKPYNSSSLVFSPRQIDYAASNNGIKEYTNIIGMRSLGSGGNFLSASYILMNGLGLMKESDMPFTTNNTQKELSSVFNYNKNLYEVNSSILFPTISSNTSSSIISSTINSIKQHIIDYGGVYVETQSSGKSCDITKSDGNHLIRVDNGCSKNSGHAMQVIGWNDNFTYSYCKSNKTHITNTIGCSSENIVSGKGAWLLRNSWGSNQPYVYLAYDSIGDIFYTYKDISQMSNRTWTNSYQNSFDPYIISISGYDEETFNKKIDTVEKLQKIKFFSYYANENYTIKVTTGDVKYNLGSFETTNPGIYTFDVSDKNIILDEETFKITISATNDGGIIKNMVSVFTSNIDSDPVINSNTLPIKLPVLTNDYSFRLLSYTKNIPSSSLITYKLLKSNGGNVTGNYLTISNNTVATNNVNTLLKIKSNIPQGIYTLELSYSSFTESIPLQIGEDLTANIYFYANNGTNNYVTQTVTQNKSFSLTNNSFSRTGYTFSKWNTASNGTGVDYSNGQTISGINSNLTLYAQWNPITYKIKYNSNGGEGTMNDETLTYGIASNLSSNSFTRSNYIFTSWNTKSDGTGTSYNNKQSVINLTTNANETITLYAQWEKPTYKIMFNSNGGIGSMLNQIFEKNETKPLSENTYSRTGYTFHSWNTASDGSGTTYSNKANYTYSSSNYTSNLYAIWTPITYKVQYNSNGGVGTMNIVTLTYDKTSNLAENTFTRTDYAFASWNTKSDGSGTTYYDKASVKNLTTTANETITLYAQWNFKTPFILRNYTLDNKSQIIDDIDTNTSLTSYKNHFTMDTGYTLSIDLEDKTSIYTGSITKIYNNNTLKIQYTNIVRGDINGDGKISSIDYVKVKNHIMGTNTISNTIYQKSADANKDSKISSLDYIRIKNIIMNG